MAEIQLPARSRAGGSQRRRQGNIPTAADVPTVGIQRDPGLQVPKFGDGEGLVAAGKGLMDFGHSVDIAAQRQQKLFDATATTEGQLSFEKQGMEEFRRLQVEDDPARLDFVLGYEKWLDGRQGDVLKNLPKGTSPEAQERLRLKLKTSGQTMTQAAGRLSLQEGEKKAQDAIGQQINKWSAQASRDPDFLDAFLDTADIDLSEFKDSMTANAERDTRTKARASIIEAGIAGLVNQKRFLEAETLIASGKFDADLDPVARAKANAVIDAGRREKLARDEKEETTAQKRLKLRQEDNAFSYWQRLSPDAENPLTLIELNTAAQNRGIDKGDYNALKGALDKNDLGHDDPKTVNDLHYGIVNGTISLADIRDTPSSRLSVRTRSTLIDKWASVSRGGGIESTKDYKDAIETLKRTVITTGPLAQFVKQDEQGKYDFALRELDGRIKRDKITLESLDRIQGIVADMVPRYASQPPAPTSLPSPRFGARPAKPEDILALAQQTAAAFQSGKIDQDTFQDEDRLLRQYEEILRRDAELKQIEEAERAKRAAAGTARGK